MDKPISRAIKKVQKNKKVDEAIITGTLAALGKGAAIAGKALAKGAAVVGKAGSSAAKAGVKAGTKAGSAATKTFTKVTKGMAKGSKTATKELPLKDRMAAAYDRNKDLIKNKRGLPSNKMANSGKKTVDPKKNTTTNTSNNTSEKKTTTTNNTSQNNNNTTTNNNSQNNKNTTTNKERNKNIDKKLNDIENNNNKKKPEKPDYLGKSRRVVKKTGEKVADATGAITSAYGTSSFKKESITFRDFLNNL